MHERRVLGGARTATLSAVAARLIPSDQLGFVSGGMLSASQELKPIALALSPVPLSVPRWGSSWKSWLKANAQSIGSVMEQMECLPYESNFLDLDPVARDRFGIPVIRVTHTANENEAQGFRFLTQKLEEWLGEAGASETWSSKALFVEARHCYGGTRMGRDPETSVVDADGFSHEAPNLALLGTSTFPTTGGCNPTLTVQALAWRTAERLIALWPAITRP